MKAESVLFITVYLVITLHAKKLPNKHLLNVERNMLIHDVFHNFRVVNACNLSFCLNPVAANLYSVRFHYNSSKDSIIL